MRSFNTAAPLYIQHQAPGLLTLLQGGHAQKRTAGAHIGLGTGDHSSSSSSGSFTGALQLFVFDGRPRLVPHLSALKVEESQSGIARSHHQSMEHDGFVLARFFLQPSHDVLHFLDSYARLAACSSAGPGL